MPHYLYKQVLFGNYGSYLVHTVALFQEGKPGYDLILTRKWLHRKQEGTLTNLPSSWKTVNNTTGVAALCEYDSLSVG